MKTKGLRFPEWTFNPLTRFAVMIAVFAGAVSGAGETNLTLTVDGITYSNVTFHASSPSSVEVWYSSGTVSGIITVPLAKLPPALQQKFGYDREQANRYDREQYAAQERRKAWDKIVAATVNLQGSIDRIDPDGIVVLKQDASTNNNIPDAPFPVLLARHPRQAALAVGDDVKCRATLTGVRTNDHLRVYVYVDEALKPAPMATAPETNDQSSADLPQKTLRPIRPEPVGEFTPSGFVSLRDLKADPDRYRDQHITVQGEVTQAVKAGLSSSADYYILDGWCRCHFRFKNCTQGSDREKHRTVTITGVGNGHHVTAGPDLYDCDCPDYFGGGESPNRTIPVRERRWR